MISDHCAAVLAARERWYPTFPDVTGSPKRHHPLTIADPSVTARLGMLSSKQGIPATIATEYQDQSGNEITLTPGNNDRKAGRARISQLLRLDPVRRFPEWHSRRGQKGAPRLFIVGPRCPHLIEQIKGAPLLAIDSGKADAGEIVDPQWETVHGHAHAALRYGMMSRPDATDEAETAPDDTRSIALMEWEQKLNDRTMRPRLIQV
jgi:hypothetical protein